jgi:hypothetical protein
MSDNTNPTAQENQTDADAVLALQETPSEENDVEAHAVKISTLSASIIGTCE